MACNFLGSVSISQVLVPSSCATPKTDSSWQLLLPPVLALRAGNHLERRRHKVAHSVEEPQKFPAQRVPIAQCLPCLWVTGPVCVFSLECGVLSSKNTRTCGWGCPYGLALNTQRPSLLLKVERFFSLDPSKQHSLTSQQVANDWRRFGGNKWLFR